MPDRSRFDDLFAQSARVPAEPEPPRRNPLQWMLLPLALIAINGAVWVWNISQGVSWASPKPAELEAWGGNIALLSLTEQPWRLLTSMFLHAGAMHLFFNMYFLFQIGPLLVQRKGQAGFSVVYLGGGLLSSLASAWWQAITMLSKGAAPAANGLPPLKLIVSVGASGAIMAVAGALACNLVLQHYRAQPGGSGHGGYGALADKQLMQSLLRVIGINVAMGFFIPGLDQAAHLGGLLAGALLGFILPAVADRLPGPARWLRTAVAAGLSAVLLLGGWMLAANMPQIQQIKAIMLQ